MDLDSIRQVTGPMIQDAEAQAMDSLAQSRNGDPQALQKFQMDMVKYNVAFNLQTEMFTLTKTMLLSVVRSITA